MAADGEALPRADTQQVRQRLGDALEEAWDEIHGRLDGPIGKAVEVALTAVQPELVRLRDAEAELARLKAVPRPAPQSDPDKPCPHEDLDAQVNINRLTSVEGGPVTGYATEVSVWCAGCGERFRWIGVRAGHKPDRPMCSVDEYVLNAPIRPASADPDFGLGIPGFAINYRRGGT